MQLQHVEMELELLGPHKFQMPQSYTQAVRQVQHMKNLLINTTDLGLQSNFRLLLDWILHHFHDICGAESLHFSDSGCFQ